MAVAKDDFDLIADESAPNTPQQIVPNFTKKATTSSTKKAPASRKRPAPKKPAPKKPAPKKKAFKAPFAPPTKASSETDATPSGLTDASSTATTHATPATPADNRNKRGSSRKRKEPERFTVPVAVPSTKGNGFKDPTVTNKGKSPANKQAKETPQNTPAELKIEPQDDFDSLSVTPAVDFKTPVVIQDDFDSLMVTPKDPTPAQIAVAASAVKVKEEPVEAGRASRKRKQTKFFGSPVKDVEPQPEVSTAQLTKKVKTERRSNPIETIKPAPKKLTKEQMAENDKKQKAERTRRLRNELCGPMFKDTLLAVEHDPDVTAGAELIDFIPSLIQGRLKVMGRYWATDGEHFWVKPRPDPTPLIRGNMTDAEINAKRYTSPGPPVCPKMVIMLCEGRYPPDDMSVRICLTRKRNALKNRVRECERFKLSFQERYSKFFKDLVSANDNPAVKQCDLIAEGIKKLMNIVLHDAHNWTLHRFLLVKPFINDILSVKIFEDRSLNLLVDKYLENIKEDVNDDINTCDWSPGQCEDFKVAEFGFVGRNKKEVINFMRLDHDMGPMANFAPFFTSAEFELLYEDTMMETDDDELTAMYDNDGNKTGNREFRTVRELLTPFGSLSEDTADSARHDDLVQFMHYKLYEEDHDRDYNPDSEEEEEYETETESEEDTISAEGVEDSGGTTVTFEKKDNVEDNIEEEAEAEFTEEEYESDEEGLVTEVEELISSQRAYANAQPQLYWRTEVKEVNPAAAQSAGSQSTSASSSDDEYMSAEEGETSVKVEIKVEQPTSSGETCKVLLNPEQKLKVEEIRKLKQLENTTK